MKKMNFLFIALAGIYGFGQDNAMNGAPTNVLGLNGADESTMIVNMLDISKISGVFYEFDDIRFGKVPTDGSFLLFDDWKNHGVLVLGDDELTVSNINFHVDEEKFISELDNDSTFVYDFKGISRIVVNSRPFISMYSSAENRNKVYEVISEGEKFSLVKNYYSKVTQGSPNPMLARSRNKIQLKSNYFVLINGSLLPFETNKTGFKPFLTPEQIKKISSFVKQNKLSYRKDEDLKKIFELLNVI